MGPVPNKSWSCYNGSAYNGTWTAADDDDPPKESETHPRRRKNAMFLSQQKSQDRDPMVVTIFLYAVRPGVCSKFVVPLTCLIYVMWTRDNAIVNLPFGDGCNPTNEDMRTVDMPLGLPD